MSQQPSSFASPALHPAIVELATHPQWVNWKYELRAGSKPTKPPISPRTGRRASHSRPEDWSSFEHAVEFGRSNRMAGVGFVLAQDDDLTGGDLDKCRDPETGAIEQWADEILSFAETYAEVSPSGTGIRLIWRGKVPKSIKKDAAQVEVYGTHRYLTITGNHIPGTPLEIRPAPQTLAALTARVEAFERPALPSIKPGRLREESDGTATDAETGEVFESLEEAERALRDEAANAAPALTATRQAATSFSSRNKAWPGETSLDEIAELLFWVPADTGYPEWLEALMAVHAMTGGSSAGLAIADQWSAKGSKYRPNDVSSRWPGFRGSGVGSGTLAALAKRYGADLSAIRIRHMPEDPERTAVAAAGMAASERMRANALATAAEDQAANDSEIEPIDIWSKFEPPSMPTGILPSVIEEFARVRGEMMGADPAGLAMGALVTCAAVLSDRVKLRMKRYDDYWHESARLWCALIGLPSTMKSPIISAAVAPLFQIDAEMARENRKARQQYEELKKAGENPIPPRQPRLRMEDVTMEKAQERLADSPNGLLLIQDELSGWFGSMEKYSGAKGGQKDRSFWLQSYNGGSVDVGRVGRGDIFIENLSICLLGGIQPDLIRKMAVDTGDDGFLQRMIPIVLRPSGRGQDGPTPNVVGEYHRMVHDLYTMQRPLVGGDGDLSECLEVDLAFDDDGQEIFRAYQGRFQDFEQGLELVNGKLASAIGKYRGLFGRLSVAFHCIENAGRERPPRVIPFETAQRVAALFDRFIMPHAIAFYSDVVGMAEDQDMVTEVAGFMLAHPEIKEMTFRNFARGSSKMRACKDARAAEAILERLDAFGWLERRAVERNQTAARWTVNPRIYEKFEHRAKHEKDRRERMRQTIATACAAHKAEAV